MLLERAELGPVGAHYIKASFSSTEDSFLTISGPESGNECPQEIIRYLSIDGMEADVGCPSVRDTVERMPAPCGRVTHKHRQYSLSTHRDLASEARIQRYTAQLLSTHVQLLDLNSVDLREF